MGHVYDVETSDGRTHTVETDHHHSDHGDDTFKRHLLDMAKGVSQGVISGVVLRYMYRGRR